MGKTDVHSWEALIASLAQAPWSETLPGLALAAVRNGCESEIHTFGYADLADRRPAGASTIYRVGSITKAITALAVLQQHVAGRLDLDGLAARCLPNQLARRLPDRAEITVRHLLTHASGLPREAPLDYFTTLQFPAIDEIVESLAGESLLFAPGTGSEYSNVGYALLGRIIAECSGRPYREYVAERILHPLGMEHSGFDLTPAHRQHLAPGYLRDSTGHPKVHAPDPDLGAFAPAGQLYGSITDLARFLAFQLDPRHDDVLRAEWVSTMQQEELGWTAQWWEDTFVYGQDGQTFGWSADLRFAPDRGLGLAVCTNIRMNALDLSGGLLAALLAEPET